MLKLWLISFTFGIVGLVFELPIELRRNQLKKLIREEIVYYHKNIHKEFQSDVLEENTLKLFNPLKDSLLHIGLSLIPIMGFIVFLASMLTICIETNLSGLKKLRNKVNEEKESVLLSVLSSYMDYEVKYNIHLIKTNIKLLKDFEYHSYIPQEMYNSLLELIEKSFIQGSVSKSSITKIEESIKELLELTKELKSSFREQRELYLKELQPSIDEGFKKFKDLVEEIRLNSEKKVAVF